MHENPYQSFGTTPDARGERRPGAGKFCPVCDEDIGLGAVIQAKSPRSIYCPHCNARLRYRLDEDVITFYATFLIASLVVAIGFATASPEFGPPGWYAPQVAAVVLFIACFVGAEIGVSMFLRERRTLCPTDGGDSEARDSGGADAGL